MVFRINSKTRGARMVYSVLSLGYDMDVRGNVVGFTAGVRIISHLKSIQKVAVANPDPYLVGIRDSGV
jgi:hypothetical protein